MPWTYLLRCADDPYYVGSTTDLERGVSEHNLGMGAADTRPRKRRPVVVAWAGEFARVDEERPELCLRPAAQVEVLRSEHPLGAGSPGGPWRGGFAPNY